VHATAPDREGTGLFRAARAALEDAAAAPHEIGLVSAHGTATPYNDAAESKAINRALGAHARAASVQPFKAVIGHTLGAAGALESLSALAAMKQGFLPACVGEGAVTPELEARLLDRPESAEVSRALKLSSAFGGANVSLVLGARDTPAAQRERFDVRIASVGTPVEAVDATELARVLGVESSRVTRLDPVSLFALGAIAKLPESPAITAGVVVGSIASTLEIDADFERRRRARGPEPRRFPATSPNLAPGNCSILLGLVGPTLAVGADTSAPLEALLVGHDLVALGDAEEVVVVAVDSLGPFVEKLFHAADFALPRAGAQALLLRRGPGGPKRALLAEALKRARAGVSEAQPGWPALAEALRCLANDGDLPG
jgi:3-oxoacyl-[acyl-carrier-protein] synthase-1/3-oxoacyl-[acyl-carrier-protein] synthase II